jgi:hypothetical protein
MTGDLMTADLSATQDQTAYPYPPSWVDRATAWIDRLPGPAWAAYLLLALLLVGAHAAAKWYDGAYPLGTFYPLHVVVVITGVYYLAMIHFTDVTARRAMDKFRPVLDLDPAGAAELIYRLTTSPPRQVWIATLIGLIYGLFVIVGAVRGLILGAIAPIFSGPVSFWLDSIVALFVGVMFALIIYHTMRQVRMIHHIYTRHTRIDLFDLAPLYALSQFSARTAVFWMALESLWIISDRRAWMDIMMIYTIILLSALVFITFVWPFLGVHALLKEEKDRVMAEANRRLKTTMEEFHHHIDNHRHQDVAPLIQSINGLKQELELLEKIPTWPWQPDTLRTVATAVLLPMGVWLLQRALTLLLDI